MAAVLKRFLADASRRGFTWGVHDCIVFGGDWVQTVSGVDPIARWRGQYSSEAQAMEMLEAEGGAEVAISRELALLGWSHADRQVEGDVVLAVVPGHKAPVVAIAVDERRMAFVTKRGVLVWPGEALAIWHRGRANG